MPFLEWTEWFSRRAGSLASCTAESRFVALNGVCVDGEKCRDPFVIQGDAIDFEDKEADEGNFISEHEKRGSIWKERKGRCRGPAPLDWTADRTIAVQTAHARPRPRPRRPATQMGPFPPTQGDEGH